MARSARSRRRPVSAASSSAELPSSHYRDQKGRPKVVRYWTMRPLEGAFRPHDEVDEARWLPLATAEAELSYDRDREILSAFAEEEPR